MSNEAAGIHGIDTVLEEDLYNRWSSQPEDMQGTFCIDGTDGLDNIDDFLRFGSSGNHATDSKSVKRMRRQLIHYSASRLCVPSLEACKEQRPRFCFFTPEVEGVKGVFHGVILASLAFRQGGPGRDQDVEAHCNVGEFKLTFQDCLWV